jgi:hypothetical protein
MSKKIAFFIILVMLVNMTVCADEGSLTNEDVTILYIVGIGLAVILGLTIFLIDIAEAESPDDGIRLASMQTENPESKTGFGTVLNFLQHVEVGQTKDNKFYAGLRFKF